MRRMYDYIEKKFFTETEIEYGLVYAENPSDDVVLIKVGQNGSIIGFESKWIRMAQQICSKYGFTVFVSSNPFNGRDPIENAMEIIDEYYDNHSVPMEKRRVHYIGHSNGALVAAWYAYKYPLIKDMLLINMPASERYWNKTIRGLKAYDGNIIAVYGDNDPYYYKGLLLEMIFAKIKLHVVEDANHHFSNRVNQFINLPHLLFDD